MLSIVFLSSFSVKATSILIHPDMEYLDVKPYLTTAFSAKEDVDLAKLNFHALRSQNLPNQKGIIFLNFTIANPTAMKEVYLNTVYFDSVVVYVKNHQIWEKQNQQSGFLVPMRNKTVKVARTNLVPLLLHPHTTTEYIIALYSVTKTSALAADVSAKIGLHLYSKEGLYIFSTHKNIAFLLTGVLLFMMFINSGIYILGKKKSYLYLVFYNLFFMLAIVATNGLLFELGLLNNMEVNRTFRLIMWTVFPIFYLLFGKNYLQLKTKFPLGYTIVMFTLLLNLLCLIPFLFSNISLVFTILPYVFPCNALVLFVISLKLFKQHFVPAKFMVFASGVLSLGYLGIFIGVKTNFIPYVFTEIFTLIFLLLELSVFSIAVFSELRHSEKKILLEVKKRLEIEQELNQKNRELISANLKLMYNQEQLSEILANDKVTINQIKQQIKQLKTYDKNWENTFTHFQEVHPLFFDALAQTFPHLTSNDLKLCAFLKMNLSTKQIANLTGVTEIAVSKSRNRLRKKLNMPPGENIIQFIHQNI